MEAQTDIKWALALAGLGPGDLQEVQGHMHVKDFAAGAPVFFEGNSADCMYIIQAGRVRLYQYTPAGKEFSSGVWGQGYIIGLISALLGGQRFVNAQVVDNTRLLIFERKKLLACMELIPRFALNIAHLLAMLANDSIRRAAPLALEPVDIKLGRALLKLAVRASDSNTHIVQGITQEGLATMVGASRPWVNRTLAAFEQKGLIARSKQAIYLPDIELCQKVWLQA